MNAREYRQTLTEAQDRAFFKLLESKLHDSGFYARNMESTKKAMEIFYKGRDLVKPELDALTKWNKDKRDDIEAQIQKLSEQLRELEKSYREQEEVIYQKAHELVKDEQKQVSEERGDAQAERDIIERLAIAEYQKRLDKKSKKAVA